MIRPPKINVITEADYRSFHWPRIREAVAAALLGPWNVTFSSEELYRSVYNLCTQRHSALLHHDLVQVVSLHLQEESARLATVEDAAFFPNLYQHILSFKRSTEILSTGFSYLERYYLAERHGAKLPQAFASLQQQLLFHGPLRARLAVTLPLLAPGSLDPTLLSSLVKEIYAVDPDCSQLNPPLFSLYIPCFTPARSLDADARETHAVLAQLRSQTASSASGPHLKRSFNDSIMT